MIIDIEEVLKRLEAKGLTEDDICRISESSKLTLWRWKSKRTSPRLDTINLLLKALGE